MIEVQIENIIEKPSEYWIDIKLKDGQTISIIDEDGALKDYAGEKVQIVVYAQEDKENRNNYTLIGTYIKNYKWTLHPDDMSELMDKYGISEEEADESLVQSAEGAIKTKNGIFLIEKKKDLKEGAQIE